MKTDEDDNQKLIVIYRNPDQSRDKRDDLKQTETITSHAENDGCVHDTRRNPSLFVSSTFISFKNISIHTLITGTLIRVKQQKLHNNHIPLDSTQTYIITD
jgi:hypothetical protein